MPVNSPTQVTTTFITKVTDGEFDDAEALIHSEGPCDGTGELLMFVSIVFTQFLLQMVLPQIPTAISEVTVVEKEPPSAKVQTEVTVTSLVQTEVEIEVRTERCKTTDDPAPVEQWRIWDVDVAV